MDVTFNSFDFLEGKTSTTYDLNAVTACFESNEFEVRNNQYDNFKLRDLVFSSALSKKTVIYSPYMVVNKTNLSLIIGSGKKRNDLEVIANSTEYFHPRNETKLYIKAEEYSWSKEFSFSTVGVSGELSLQKSKAGQSYRPVIKDYNSNEIDIGVSISQVSTTFYKTTAITFTPRYVLCNTCKDPLILMNHHKNSNVQLRVEPGQEKVYFFENKTEGNNCIKVRNPTFEENKNGTVNKLSAVNSTEWSSIFEISDIADFQIEMNSLEEVKDVPEYKQNFPYTNNGSIRYARVMVTTKDGATLFVVFSDPPKPECVIKNKTDEVIYFKQKKVGKKKVVAPNTSVPFVWDDQSSKAQKALNFYSDTNKRSFKIDDIKKLGDLQCKNSSVVIETLAKKKFKEVVIRYKHKKEPKKTVKINNILELMITQKFTIKTLSFALNIQSIGVSIIDSSPKEIIFLAVHKPILNYVKKTGLNEKETEDNIDLTIQHFQIDNMASSENPVILCPKKLLNNVEEEKGEEEEVYTPFVQLKIERQTIQHDKTVHVRYPCLVFAIQEILVHVETATLNEVMLIINKITSVFSVLEGQYLSSKLIHEKYNKQEEEKVCLEPVKRENLSVKLNPYLPTIINDSNLKEEREYFEFVNIGAIKIILTLRFEHKYLNINMKKGQGIFSIGYTVFSNIANMTDSPLYFKELILTHTYAPPSSLLDMIIRNFTRQGVMQFYKLIGSSDMLGNPVGFVNKLGSGVYEFFNEPRKGLVKGPKEFVGGVGKGVTSLVGGVTTASLDSFSKITGSLYNATKDIAGQDIHQESAPTNIADGLFKAAKGGLSEIGTGITGLVTNPIKHTKKGGIGGFFKGVGKGIVGVAAAPVTATLKMTTSVTQGLNSTAMSLTYGKIKKQGRYRTPREISATGVIEEYNGEYSVDQKEDKNKRKKGTSRS